jgi:hypothetical protein
LSAPASIAVEESVTILDRRKRWIVLENPWRGDEQATVIGFHPLMVFVEFARPSSTPVSGATRNRGQAEAKGKYGGYRRTDANAPKKAYNVRPKWKSKVCIAPDILKPQTPSQHLPAP